MDRRLVSVGYVARPHGLQGELRVHVHNEETEAFRKGAVVVLRTAGKPDRDVRFGAVRRADKAFLVTIEGVTGREAAEALKGVEILVAREALAEPEEGEFYAADVEGARAELLDGTLVGTVKGLLTYPTCDVLVVAREGLADVEVPLVEDYVASVDVATKVVRLKHIDEL
jgi:16S rRNA processing protein RimM